MPAVRRAPTPGHVDKSPSVGGAHIHQLESRGRHSARLLLRAWPRIRGEDGRKPILISFLSPFPWFPCQLDSTQCSAESTRRHRTTSHNPTACVSLVFLSMVPGISMHKVRVFHFSSAFPDLAFQLCSLDSDLEILHFDLQTFDVLRGWAAHFPQMSPIAPSRLPESTCRNRDLQF